MARQGPTIAEAALELIRDRGPLTLDELVPPLVEAGRTKARNPRNAVRAAIDINPEFIQDLEGRWCSLATQLDGAVFTVRLTTLERREEIVLLRDDLALVEQLVLRTRGSAHGAGVHLDYLGDYFDLPLWSEDVDDVPDGELRATLGEETADSLLAFLDELGVPPGDDGQRLREMVWETRFTRVLHGPAGWLPVVGSRQLLGIAISAGAIETMALDRRAIAGLHVEAAANRVARLAHHVIGPDPSWFGPPVVSLQELLEIVATEAPELLRRPLPPFTEVVRRGGLEVVDGLVGHAGTDWDQVRWAASPDPEEAWGFEPADVIH